jgi:hypothetical protein
MAENKNRSGCCGAGFQKARNFLIEVLKEYKDELEKESQGVGVT